MEQVTINSFFDYLDKVNEFSRGFFRGVADAKYTLVPKVGRVDIAKLGEAGLAHTESDLERTVIDTFKRGAVAYLSAIPSSDWEWLAIMQHHGAPTRLLDWSYSPLVALHFAVDDVWRSDHATSGVAGAVYHFDSGTVCDTREHPDPFQLSEVRVFGPPEVSPRIAAQQGVFTIHPPPWTDYDDARITKFIIPKAIKQEGSDRLRRLGVHRAKLFPGLDTLCDHINVVCNWARKMPI